MTNASGDFHLKFDGPPEGHLKDVRTSRAVAFSMALSSGPLGPQQVRFLRRVLDITCPELADQVGTTAAAALLAESRADRPLGIEEDIELRRLVLTHLGFDIPPCSTLCRQYHSMRQDMHIPRLAELEAALVWESIAA